MRGWRDTSLWMGLKSTWMGFDGDMAITIPGNGVCPLKWTLGPLKSVFPPIMDYMQKSCLTGVSHFPLPFHFPFPVPSVFYSQIPFSPVKPIQFIIPLPHEIVPMFVIFRFFTLQSLKSFKKPPINKRQQTKHFIP